MFLTDGKFAHQTQPHKLLPRASLCITVTQIPTSCLVWWSGLLLAIFVIAGCSLAGWVVRLLPSGEVIFFVADHFKLACTQWILIHKCLCCKTDASTSLLKNISHEKVHICATTSPESAPSPSPQHLGYCLCLAGISTFPALLIIHH